jgi:D-glycero-alpha-D-manno-heptose-7-phosphate kinase
MYSSTLWIMIISRTPLRISFAGGGSDLRAYYQQEAGAVVSTAIDKYIYITVNKKFDHQIRASYSVTEIVDRLSALRHELIREALRVVGIQNGIEITSISDVPSHGTGLGSSSTYTVGLLNALYAYIGRHVGAERLAREACQIEIARCGKPIGKQDQYIAAYGGLQYIQFNPDESVFVDPIICSSETKQRIQEHLLMLYTGIARSADDVLVEQTANTIKDKQRRNALRDMTQLAQELREALYRNDVESFGEILHQGWLMKRSLASSVSNSQIDDWYARARRHGAIGGKILGAGGGGFLLLYAPPERHQEIASALPGLRAVPFRFELQGSKIIYVEEGSSRGEHGVEVDRYRTELPLLLESR